MSDYEFQATLEAAVGSLQHKCERLEYKCDAAVARAEKAEALVAEHVAECKAITAQLEEVKVETKKLRGLIREWWDSSKLGLGSGEFESWLSTFTPRVAIALSMPEPCVPDGTPGIRDARCPCEYFEPGAPEGISAGGHDCHSDGHYLCEECVHKIQGETK